MRIRLPPYRNSKLPLLLRTGPRSSAKNWRSSSMGDIVRLFTGSTARTGGDVAETAATLNVPPDVSEGRETSGTARQTKFEDLYAADDAKSTALIKRARDLLSKVDQRA